MTDKRLKAIVAAFRRGINGGAGRDQFSVVPHSGRRLSGTVSPLEEVGDTYDLGSAPHAKRRLRR
mgnify:CR=1 FL=1